MEEGRTVKRRKPNIHVPGEIKNMIYLHSTLPANVEPEERTLKAQGGDLDIVRTFYVDTVGADGRSTLFTNKIVEVTELTEDVLTCIMPYILFRFTSASALELFLETLLAHLSVCDSLPELHIEVDLFADMDKDQLAVLEDWSEKDLPHGRGADTFKHIKKWMQGISNLPKTASLQLIFTHIWGDFRELRGLSHQFGITERSISFQFPIYSKPTPRHNLFEAQTIAAVQGKSGHEMRGRQEISKAQRAKLVRIGLRGFS